MEKLIAYPNKDKNNIAFKTQYARNVFNSFLKKYKKFEIIPVVEESVRSRRYLEGAIIPAYCEWQYQINAKDTGKDEQRRFLFKRDFNYEIVKTRTGNPVKSPISSKGLASSLSRKYTEWAEENGAPIPNPKLYKLWRDKYSLDDRFPTFFDFLDFLEIECDANPTPRQLEKLKVEEEIEYPVENIDQTKTPF